MNTTPTPAEVDPMTEALRDAMRKAFNLGQTYWQQADSDSTAQHRRSDETRAKFNALTEDTIRSLVEGRAAALLEPVGAAGADLHAAIMNLPCTLPASMPYVLREAYSDGHRDARHAAAELVAAAPAVTAEDTKDALSESELRTMAKLPGALRALADWHSWQETMADAIGEPFEDCVKHHEQRRKELTAEAERIEKENEQ